MKIYILLILLSVALMSACHKEKGKEECIWSRETTAMSAGICKMASPTSWDDCSTVHTGDTVPYQLFQLALHFESCYLPYEVCSTPRDSIIGNIASLQVIALNTYNAEHQIGDTLNDIMNVRALDYLGAFSSLKALVTYLGSQPACTSDIGLFFTQAPAAAGTQAFRLVYSETDGTLFTAETMGVVMQ